jgi:hypothetical protein
VSTMTGSSVKRIGMEGGCWGSLVAIKVVGEEAGARSRLEEAAAGHSESEAVNRRGGPRWQMKTLGVDACGRFMVAVGALGLQKQASVNCDSRRTGMAARGL